jgi:hypothetical protein
VVRGKAHIAVDLSKVRFFRPAVPALQGGERSGELVIINHGLAPRNTAGLHRLARNLPAFHVPG